MAGLVLAVAGLAFAAPAIAQNPTPLYQFDQGDAFWTYNAGPDNWTVSLTPDPEDYLTELWERPIKDCELCWVDIGTTRFAYDEYFAYADLKGGGYGWDSFGGAEWIYAKWEVVGGYSQAPNGDIDSGVGYKGHYYFYIELPDEVAILVEITDANSISGTDWANDSVIKVWYEPGEGNVPGTPGNATSKGSETGFDNSSDVTAMTRRNGSVIEVAVNLAGVTGYSLADFANDAEFAYIGAAVSNPSSPAVVFANANFRENRGEGQEYDTLFFDEQPPNPSIQIEKSTNGQDADAAPGPLVPVGNAVTWTYAVENTGDTVLTGVAVSDDVLGAITCNWAGSSDGATPAGTLSPGETVSCSANGTAVAGQYENTGTVLGSSPGNTDDVTDSDDSHYFGSNPSIGIEKSTNGSDADSAPGPSIAVGATVNWAYVVTNTGNVNLTGVLVTDSPAQTITCDWAGSSDGATPAGTLSPGETVSCSASGTATIGQYTNTGSVVGTPPVGSNVNDTDPSHYFGTNPAIQIVKTASPTTYAVAGTVITYGFAVTNTGNVTLTSVDVTDPLTDLSAIACTGENNPIADLAPGETVNCSATYSIKASDVTAGQVDNTATAEGECAVANCPVDDDDPETVTRLDQPAIEIVKTGSPKVYTAAGQTITYSFQVTNNGNVTLTDVTVTDTKSAVGAIDCGMDGVNDNDNVIPSLASGASVTCTADYTITAGDITAGKVDNTATVVGRCEDEGSCPVDDEDDETVNARLINLTKTVTSGPTYDPVTGRYTVVYRIQATSSGTVGGTYDVEDKFDLAPGLNLFGTPTVAYIPGDDSLDAANDPPGWPVIATAENIGAGKTEGWDVTAQFTVTPGDLTAAARSCDESDAQPQTGFYNSVLATANETNTDDNDDCVDLPDPDLDLSKVVTNTENTGFHTWRITYLVKVVNSGDGPGQYDIDDVTGFAPGVTLDGTPAVTYVAIDDLFASPVTTPAWTKIADDETIAGQKSESWQVVANVSIDDSNVDYEANRQCATNEGGYVSGKGFFNRVDLSGFDEQNLVNNKACSDPDTPTINLEKAIAGGPTANADGTFTVIYAITATNSGQAIGAYDLKDTFDPGSGITLKSAVLNYVGGSDAGQSGAVQGGSLPADFDSGDIVVTGETLAAGKNEVWTVTAVFNINTIELDLTRKCSQVEFGQGTGFYNFVEGNIDEDLTDNHACGSPEPGVVINVPVNNPWALFLMVLMVLGIGWHYRPVIRRTY